MNKPRKTNMLRIALAQINTTVGDLTGNRQKIVEYIGRAKSAEADIVVFPELAVCGYPPEDLLYKEHFVLDNKKILGSLIRETKGITAIVGFVDMDKNKKLYNAAAIIHHGVLKGVYHKEQLPNYGVFDEKRYFEPGVNNKIYRSGQIIFGVNICEDIWIDQGNDVTEHQAKMGAKLIINISSSPYDLHKLSSRKKLLISRAKKTKAYVCYTNLIGGQDELVFDGGSFMVDPKGKIIAMGKQFEEDLVMADLNIKKSPKKQIYRRKNPVISLSPLLQKAIKKIVKTFLSRELSQIEGIHAALVLGTRDYIRKNGFKKVLIGLSGGIDSSLVAALAVEAIGHENVIGVTMPSRFTSEGTRGDAFVLANNFNIQLKEIPIEPIYKAYLNSLAKEFEGLQTNIAEENIQARIRGNLLMALSNKFGWLVLTTGNKSELAVGYCTLYGDMSGGFAVIKDVTKTQVYALAKFINSRGQEIIPESAIERVPTAELRANQKDQDTLPEYDVLDKILRHYVEDKQSFGQIAKKENAEIVKKVIGMVDFNEYKRRQSPPGVKITPRAFGKDWRLPITNKYREF